MNEQLIADLKETRRQLEVRGRCVGDLVNKDGKVCLDGAVGVACIPSYNYNTAGYDDLEKSPRAKSVISALCNQLKGMELRDGFGDVVDFGAGTDLVECIFTFNDLETTTDQDCFDLIDKALAEQGGL